ncbi:MAG: ABC transporter permease [Chitinophagaceae bacterium]|nr:ABC transporter permease [Chitinophagaceae bacterium]
MNKILLIIQREYLTRVRKRSFLLTTILVPIVIIAFYAAIIAVAVSDTSEKEKIAVIDEAQLFNGKIGSDQKSSITYDLIQNETFESFKKEYDDKGYSALLYIPALDISHPDKIQLQSQSAISLNVKKKIENKVDKAIEQKRLNNENIDPQKYESIKSDISIPNTLDSGNGEKKSVEGVAYAVAFAAGILIYMILLIYGSMVMRGVMEEKTNRISEVIISSVKPFQLMMGKIIGIGAVGITQFIIWIVLIGLLQFTVPLLFPSLTGQIPQTGTEGVPMASDVSMISKITEGLQSIPVGLLLFCFLFYFLGGYLMYASLFAAIGSVSEDQQEAQQLVFPVMMPIILGFVILTKAIQDPNSGLALFGSLFPLTSPIVMLGRIPFGVPWTELFLSMALLILFFLFCTWLAGRIYRTGILMYGKKGSWKEMMKWAFKRS